MNLGEDRGNLTLWSIYARLELAKGNLHAARNVFSTAVSSSMSGTDKCETFELWGQWAMMEWELNAQARCRDILLRLVDRGSTRESRGWLHRRLTI